MENSNLDQFRLLYKSAVDAWVAAIRAEESLATPDHSIIAMEQWDRAAFAEQDAQAQAKAARDKYRDALRLANYGI